MANRWRYALHDLLTGAQLVDHIPFKIDSYGEMLAEAGTLTATLPLGDPAIRARQPRDTILTRRGNLVIFRDEQPVWDGIIWTRRRSRGQRGNDVTFSAAEVRSYFNRRLFRPEGGFGFGKTLAFTSADLFEVFRAILTDAQDISVSGLTPGDIRVEADPALMSGVLINRRDVGSELGAYHGYEFTSHGQLLDDLAATDPGLEWRIVPYLDGGVLRRRLLLGSPKLGNSAVSTDLETFEFPGRILEYEWPDDGEAAANYLAALGSGDGDSLRWAEAYNTAELLAGWPLTEATTSYKDISDAIVLGQRATADSARLAGDRTVPSIRVQGYPDVPIGDHIKLRIVDEDWFVGSSVTPYEAVMRVVGKTVTPGQREKTDLILEEPR